MFAALERLPMAELSARWQKCREIMQVVAPSADGMLVFSKLNIYYLSGSLVSGVFWLPLEGEPVLLVRRGLERVKLESPMEHLGLFRSYRQIATLAAEFGSPLGATVAVEKQGLPWALAESLQKNLSGQSFVSGDFILAKARSLKSEWELEKMRICGERHNHCLYEIIPSRIKPGMTEREISHITWNVFFENGHSGMMRMGGFGEEVFLGHVSAGDSGNYPSTFDGPLGLRGEHPAVPFMGYRGKLWSVGQPLALDVGFTVEGYNTDKTQTYWAGNESSIPVEVTDAHEFCIAIQNWIAERLKPGAIPSELYSHCVQWAEKEGFADGFMALEPNKVAFIGHGIGLTIDGYPVIAKGFDEPVVSSQVLALEPKIGIPGVGMVGVENTFVVTEEGGKCLTGDNFNIIAIEG